MDKFTYDKGRFVALWGEGGSWYAANNFLAEVIVAVVSKYRELKHGYPCELEKTTIDWWEITEEESRKAEAAATAEWDRILDEIIWTFSSFGLEEHEFKYHAASTEYDEAYARRFDDGMLLFVEWFHHLWD